MRVDPDLEELQGGYLAFPAQSVLSALSARATGCTQQVRESFERLVQDQQMGDGGRYRFRRFSRLAARFSGDSLSLEPLSGHSILQSREDNPLNGGVLRTFEPLEPSTMECSLLQELIGHDATAIRRIDPEFFQEPVVVGVHQVRIIALPESLGKPTPEGIHRDAERYTFQHFWQRQGIEGGEFTAYDQAKNPVFRWLQTEMLDSVLFTGTTWHSASPIQTATGTEQGFRDIFLIDFDPI